MLEMGIPVGAGTDATRVSSYNPWVSLYWLVTGKTVGGAPLYSESNRMSRAEALRLYTSGSAWFSGEDQEKGAIVPGQLADLAVLSADYFSVPEEQIKQLESILTIVDGKVVHGSGEFGPLAPPLPPVSPGWSPVATYGGYPSASATSFAHGAMSRAAPRRAQASTSGSSSLTELWGAGCDCFAF
jgi:hypothetical protein